MVAGGLRQPNVSRNDRGADFVAKVFTDLLDNLNRQLGSGVVHHAQDGADLKGGVEILFDFVNIAQQLAETFKGVILTLNGDQDFTGGH